jgi:hypothetical protein
MTQDLSTITMDGTGAQISFGGANLQEVSISPPSVTGGGALEVTTHRNGTWRTKAPKTLKDLGEVSFSAVYDPAEFNTTGLGKVNVNQSITVTFPDTSTLVFYGFIDSFTPGEITPGELPTVDVTIVVTNQAGAGTTGGAETAPVYTSA